MTKQCNNFMERMEAKIGNYNQPLFDGMHPDRVYCGAFDTPMMLTTAY